MKSIRKCIRNIDWEDFALRAIFAMLVVLWFGIFVWLISDARTKNKTATDFVPAVKYGEVDNGNTLFMTEDGNLYAFHAHVAEQNGSRFLMEVRVNDPKDQTDDELLELWATPQVEYDIDWAE